MDSWQIWKESLKSPRYILAPMVDHSELPWRMLSREFGCQAAYTPMFHAANFAKSKKYREKYFSTCPEDRPLIVQFCANNSQTILEAAKYVVNLCDGIDINLGCPQEIAKRGHYGAFLQDEWNLIEEMITTLRSNIPNNVAVSCKIRRFDDLNKTIEYAKMLEKAGCNFVGIHARTREQRGCKTGVADWSFIKAVKENLTIPVVANGNIQSLDDAEECLSYTKADAIMTAEGNLYNPCILMNIHPPAWFIARKYLDYVKKYHLHPGCAKSHLFKLFHKCIAMEENYDLRVKLGSSHTLENLYEVVELFEKKYSTSSEIDKTKKEESNCSQTLNICTLPIPPYLCQPRYRYSVENNEQLNGDNKNSKIIMAFKTSCEDKQMDFTNELTSQKRIKLN